MNTKKTAFRSNCRMALAAVAFVTAGLGSAQATDYYLQTNHDSSHHWNRTNDSQGWFTATTGGTLLATMDPAGVYYSNGKAVRSRDTTGNDTFEGDTLVLNGSGTSFILKIGANSTAAVNHLIVADAASVSAGNTSSLGQRLSVGTFDIDANITFGVGTGGRGYRLNVDTLTGSQNLIFDKSAAITGHFMNFDIGNADAFSGGFFINSGTLLFTNDLNASSASLNIATGSFVNLTHSISVFALSVGGDTLADGTYDFNYLSTHYGSIFTAGDALNGRIVVGSTIPEPAGMALLTGGIALGMMGFARRPRSWGKASAHVVVTVNRLRAPMEQARTVSLG
ncbi:MAG: hypothetical protein ABII82_20555 [Verrucomicrobiota bacterium]